MTNCDGRFSSFLEGIAFKFLVWEKSTTNEKWTGKRKGLCVFWTNEEYFQFVGALTMTKRSGSIVHRYTYQIRRQTIQIANVDYHATGSSSKWKGHAINNSEYAIITVHSDDDEF